MSGSDLSDFQTPDAEDARAAAGSGGAAATGILVDKRWQESDVADVLKATCKVEFRSLGNADFQPSSGLTVLFLCEADYVGGARAFKQKVARFYSSRAKTQAIVVCQKTEMSSLDFLTVQEFVVIELGLALLPVTDQSQLPQLIQQLSSVQSKPNPLKYGAKSGTEVGLSRQQVQTLAQVPSLGEKRARMLLESMGSLHAVAMASEPELAKIVGASAAKSVAAFFTWRS